MKDMEIIQAFRDNSAPCTETLGAKFLEFTTMPPSIVMEFKALDEFTHSDGMIVQGGFVTGMLDAPMAHLLIGLFDFKIIPMTLDINVSFLAPSRQGQLIAKAEDVQLGKSIAFMSSRLFQEDKLVATATSTIRLISK